MSRLYFFILFTVIFIYVTHGMSLNFIVLWNMLPAFLSVVVYLVDKKQKVRSNSYGAYGFLFGCMLLSGYIHLAWYFNLGEMRSEASTTGMLLFFTPVYSLLPGVIGYFIGRNIMKTRVGID